MKLFYYLFLFLHLNSTAQNNVNKSNIAVISAAQLNVVYRGVLNPLNIAIPNCKSFTVTGTGLTKNEEGKYYLSPGQGLYSIIKVDIVLNDNSKISEEHKFRIKGISSLFGKINDKDNCERCILEMTKDELYSSTIRYGIPEGFLFDLNNSDYKINSFIVKFSNKKIVVNGNKFDDEINDQIKKSKNGSIFIIDDISYSFPGSESYLLPRLLPIKIIIIEKEIQEDYFKNKEFIRDSIKKIKHENKILLNK